MQRHNTFGRQRQVVVLRDHDSVWAPEAKAGVLESVKAIHDWLGLVGHAVIPIQVRSPEELPGAFKPYDPDRCVVFNLCDGVEPEASDIAQVAALLEELGFTYTGADARTLLATQDKTCTKRVLVAHGIPTPAWSTVLGSEFKWDRYPAIVKVADEHGSEALTPASVVYDQQSLQARVAELATLEKQYLMVSEFIDGREFTVALWGNGRVQALPLVEMDYSAYPSMWPRLRSFEAKWQTDSPMYQRTKLVCPPHLSAELQNRIERVALDTYHAVNLRDYGRVDIRVRDDVPYVIDVNANPDLSAGSSFVIAAERAGYDYGAMLGRIVEWAAQRAEARLR
jgi:D-alanine-D-alanine ligase